MGEVFFEISLIGERPRRYEYVIALRAVETIDFMTARWAHLPYELLETVSNRIIVDVESLRSCLMAYDLKQPGLDVLEIGLQVMWVSSAEAKDLIEDGRSRGKEYDLAELQSHSAKASKKYWKVYDKVVAVLNKKQAEEERIFERAIERDNKGLERGLASIGRQRIDYLSDERIREAMLKEGYVKTFEERTKRKRYIRTHTHRMIAKAVKNIEAVEKGTFGVGH